MDSETVAAIATLVGLAIACILGAIKHSDEDFD